jgi:hypothetical protein
MRPSMCQASDTTTACNAHSRRTGCSHLPSSALGKLRDICGNCPGLARLALPCGGTPAAIPYIHLRSSDGKDARKDVRKDASRKDVRKDIF